LDNCGFCDNDDDDDDDDGADGELYSDIMWQNLGMLF